MDNKFSPIKKERKHWKCRKGLEIKPCKSAAGWYMGTLDVDGCPNCRLSTGYAKTEEEAWNLPLDRGYAVEIKWCAGEFGCLSDGKELSNA